MKHFTRNFICYIGSYLLILVQPLCLSATDLGVGDLAFSTFNTDGNKSFSFVLLTDITDMTTIYFTDTGWDDDADGGGVAPTWRSPNEGTLTWTYTGDLTCGTEIAVLNPGLANTPSGFATLDGSTEVGTLSETGAYNLSGSNDALIAYTGIGETSDGSEVTNFIAAVYVGSGGWSSNASSTTTSALPPGLTDGINSMETKSGNDNWAYDCSIVFAEVDELRTSLNNNQNFGSGFTATADTTSAFLCTFTCASAASDFTWTGTADTDWTTASNWSPASVPTANDDVTIPDVANDPIIMSDVTVNSIDIETGASVTISSHSLKINNETTLNGDISVASGASFFPWALITGSGSATVFRNTTFGVTDGQYSVIGSPVATGSTSSLGNIVYSYNEETLYDPGVSDGSNRFEAVTEDENMEVGDAYFSANTGAISFAGIPNSGTYEVDLVYNESVDDGGATTAGFNLVSNPYTAAINYDRFVAGNMDIDGTIYLWDDGGSNMGAGDNDDYITANSIGVAMGGSGRDGAWDGYIRSSQGFFVKATAADELFFTPTMMDAGNNTDGGYFRTKTEETLRFSLSTDDSYSDILIAFADNATDDIDRGMDAQKLKGGGDIQLYSRAAEAILAIQALPLLTEVRTVELGFDAAAEGSYKLTLDDIGSYAGKVYLVDHLLAQTIDLKTRGFYAFHSKAENNSSRFSLVFGDQQVLTASEALSNNMVVYDNLGELNIELNISVQHADVSIFNIGGVLIENHPAADFSDGKWNSSFNKKGLFIVNVQSKGQTFTQKLLKR